MHPALIICIALMSIVIGISIVVAIHENSISTGFAIFWVGCILIGGLGFGMICAIPHWNTTYQKISPTKVESSVFEHNGIVAISYDKELYQSTDITFLNAVKNIDYYELERSFNAYGIEVEKKLYPVEKGKINDYIKEK